LASIFISWRGLAVLAAINCAGLLLLPLLLPLTVRSYASIITPLAVNTIGATLALISMRHRDRIERDRQAELGASEERLQLALDAARMGTWDWDLLTDTITWSKHVPRLLDQPADVCPTTAAAYLALVHPDDRRTVERAVAAALAKEADDYRVEHRVWCPSGSLHWLVAQGRVYRDPTGRPVRLVGTVMDITARKHAEADRAQAEAALHASEERYRVISEVVSDYAFAYWVDADGTTILEWVTDAMTRLLGYTPEEMRTSSARNKIVHSEDLPIAARRQQRLLAGQSDISEYRMIAKDGQTLWLRFYSRPVWDAAAGRVVRIYGAVQDITQIKQLEQQLNQAQKMEAIGRMAGGIAHDFNNLLTVIFGNVELLLFAIPEGDPIRQDAEQIRHAADRAAALIRQMLAISRRQMLEPRRLDLNTVVADTSRLLKRSIGEDIQLFLQLAPDLGPVHADPGQLEQVLMNLVMNARDAMPSGGMLTIETANVAVHEAYVCGHVGVERGSYIVLTISDTGVGMDAATRARIFEPFYTTKPAGKGTGLGLATVHGIVAQSGGHIWVYSEPGYGTTFKIYLPRIDAAGEAPRSSEPPPQAPPGDATILLVEDEPLLRSLVGRVLLGYGYRILEAEDGPAALRVADAHEGSIDLLLTDVIMPGGINGHQLAEQVIARRPAIKVLYMSGYTEMVTAQMLIANGQAFVQKPFTPDTLARKVAETIRG
jgi:PAS domain S-box-containing protein